MHECLPAENGYRGTVPLPLGKPPLGPKAERLGPVLFVAVQVPVAGRDDGVGRQVVAHDGDPVLAGAAAHLGGDGVQAQVLLDAGLEVPVLGVVVADGLAGDDLVGDGAGGQRRQQLGAHVRVARQLQEQAGEGARRGFGAGQQDLGHLVHDVARAHGRAAVGLPALLDQVLQQVAPAAGLVVVAASVAGGGLVAVRLLGGLFAGRERVGAPALHHGIDGRDHLGRPVKVDVEAEHAQELFDVDHLVALREPVEDGARDRLPHFFVHALLDHRGLGRHVVEVVHQIDLDAVELGRVGIGGNLVLVLVEQLTHRLLEVLFEVVNVDLDQNLLERVLVGDPDLSRPQADDGAVLPVASLDELPDLARAKAPTEVHGRQGSVPRARNVTKWGTVGLQDAAHLKDGDGHYGQAEDYGQESHVEVLAK
ncbi:uncharacterized protein PpBr36_09867 [Pyricularia pennisetigena]|uniref:uncharacterized protein n=1 Tax=Pyricularia pennisetigena TaxID=1578925 RepID=UPI00114F6794|nr:uncharacterized protein PpBr36_09867 [Pyricularia pennisetigena]TLS22520.1 hypothetical protein PpBr36_09867 [Pyricularia pennisetigena]